MKRRLTVLLAAWVLAAVPSKAEWEILARVVFAQPTGLPSEFAIEDPNQDALVQGPLAQIEFDGAGSLEAGFAWQGRNGARLEVTYFDYEDRVRNTVPSDPNFAGTIWPAGNTSVAAGTPAVAASTEIGVEASQLIVQYLFPPIAVGRRDDPKVRVRGGVGLTYSEWLTDETRRYDLGATTVDDRRSSDAQGTGVRFAGRSRFPEGRVWSFVGDVAVTTSIGDLQVSEGPEAAALTTDRDQVRLQLDAAMALEWDLSKSSSASARRCGVVLAVGYRLNHWGDAYGALQAQQTTSLQTESVAFSGFNFGIRVRPDQCGD